MFTLSSQDLEIAADFKIQVTLVDLFENLRSSDHVQVYSQAKSQLEVIVHVT